MTWEQIDLDEESLNSFFNDSFLGISDVWSKIQYRILAVPDPLTKQLTDSKVLIPLGVALYLLPENEKTVLPLPKPLIIEPFEFLDGHIPFTKEAFMQLIHQFVQPPNNEFHLDSDFVLWGEPSNIIYYQHFYEPNEKGPYPLAFPITIKRTIKRTEIDLFRIYFDSVESRIKRQIGDRLENIVRKWLGPTTNFYQPNDPQNEGIFLTIHAPSWIKFSDLLLYADNLEFSILAPPNLRPKKVKVVIDSNGGEQLLEQSVKEIEFPIKSKWKLPTTPKKIEIRLLCNDFILEKRQIHNKGVLNSRFKLLERMRNLDIDKQILNIQKKVKEREKVNLGSPNHLEQLVLDLFTTLGFTCFFTGTQNDMADLVAFRENEKGIAECYVIECSEIPKGSKELTAFFARTKSLGREIGCEVQPIFITSVKREDIKNQKDFAKIALLTSEDIVELNNMSKRNEPLSNTIRYIDLQIVPPREYRIDPILAQHPDIVISVYLEYERLVEDS